MAAEQRAQKLVEEAEADCRRLIDEGRQEAARIRERPRDAIRAARDDLTAAAERRAEATLAERRAAYDRRRGELSSLAEAHRDAASEAAFAFLLSGSGE